MCNLEGEKTRNEINELILDFAQDDANIDLNQPPDIPELEKFFLFMTKLSISQIDKLNEDQPKDNFEKNQIISDNNPEIKSEENIGTVVSIHLPININ